MRCFPDSSPHSYLVQLEVDLRKGLQISDSNHAFETCWPFCMARHCLSGGHAAEFQCAECAGADSCSPSVHARSAAPNAVATSQIPRANADARQRAAQHASGISHLRAQVLTGRRAPAGRAATGGLSWACCHAYEQMDINMLCEARPACRVPRVSSRAESCKHCQ